MGHTDSVGKEREHGDGLRIMYALVKVDSSPFVMRYRNTVSPSTCFLTVNVQTLPPTLHPSLPLPFYLFPLFPLSTVAIASLLQPNCGDQTCTGLTRSGGLTNAIIRMARVEVAVVGSCPGSSAGAPLLAPGSTSYQSPLAGLASHGEWRRGGKGCRRSRYGEGWEVKDTGWGCSDVRAIMSEGMGGGSELSKRVLKSTIWSPSK